jgi:hypothetical protein
LMLSTINLIVIAETMDKMTITTIISINVKPFWSVECGVWGAEQTLRSALSRWFSADGSGPFMNR